MIVARRKEDKNIKGVKNMWKQLRNDSTFLVCYLVTLANCNQE